MQSLPSKLIVTKLARPVLHSRLVHRERLIECLRSGMRHKLTSLIAPAGFGKTTLLSEWLASPSAAGWPVAWLSLDEEDNHPVRFWEYFTASLEQIHPQLKDLLAGAQWQEPDGLDAPFITALVNAISSIPEPFSLVLDDYHLVQNEAIHDGLSQLLRYLPASMHLIVASRKEPPLSISRLRAQNDVVEIRFDDLKFTSAETNTFLTQIMGLALPSYQVCRLANMTEGWIAGLVLAAPALQHLSTPSEVDNFIAHFGGDYKHIFNYLTVEVLNHLTPLQREFLLKTSILPELNAQLCDAILGIADSQAILSELEDLNLFLNPTSEQRQWFRYHTLFANSLQRHLSETGAKSEIDRLHLAACDWHRARRDVARAIPHALAAEQGDLAAEILEEYLFDECSRASTEISFQDWFKQLPSPVLDRHPDLRLHWATLCLVHGFFDQTETILQELERSLTLPANVEFNTPLFHNRILALRTAIQCITGDDRQILIQARNVLKTLSETDSPKVLLDYYLALAYQAGGDQAFDIEDWKAVIRSQFARKDSSSYLFSQALLAYIYEQRGQLYMAAEVYQESLEYIQAHKLESMLLSLVMQMGLSDVYREWNEREPAEQLAANAKERFLGYQTGEPCWLHSTRTCLLLARNSVSFGSLKDADTYIEIASHRARTFSTIPSLMAIVDEVRVPYWLSSGKTHMAAAWARNKETLYAKQAPETDPAYRLLIAQVALAEQRFDQALAWLDGLVPVLEAKSLGKLHLKALVLRALALWELGRQADAVQAMQNVLPDLARESFVRTLVEMQPGIEPLLRAAAQVGRPSNGSPAPDSPTAAFLQRVLAAFHPGESRDRPAGHPGSVMDPTYERLTERETEVLTLLASGLSSGRIAARLSIATSTAKTHIRNIYQKLGANTRERSLDRAHDLGLI